MIKSMRRKTKPVPPPTYSLRTIPEWGLKDSSGFLKIRNSSNRFSVSTTQMEIKFQNSLTSVGWLLF